MSRQSWNFENDNQVKALKNKTQYIVQSELNALV